MRVPWHLMWVAAKKEKQEMEVALKRGWLRRDVAAASKVAGEMTTAERADLILRSGCRGNLPHSPGKRIVGWIVDEDLAGLSDGLFAIEAIEKRARHG